MIRYEVHLGIDQQMKKENAFVPRVSQEGALTYNSCA